MRLRSGRNCFSERGIHGSHIKATTKNIHKSEPYLASFTKSSLSRRLPFDANATNLSRAV